MAHFGNAFVLPFFFGFLPAEVLNGFCRFETFFAAPGGICQWIGLDRIIGLEQGSSVTMEENVLEGFITSVGIATRDGEM